MAYLLAKDTINGAEGKVFITVDGKNIEVAATVFPDVKDKELCDAYGVMDPLLVPGKMLLSGEYSRLMREITDLSGFDALEEEAKN